METINLFLNLIAIFLLLKVLGIELKDIKDSGEKIKGEFFLKNRNPTAGELDIKKLHLNNKKNGKLK